MATTSIPAASVEMIRGEWRMPDRGTVGILCMILAESSLFAIFVCAYVFYMGRSLNGPYPKDVLDFPVLASICLLSSSGTIMIAEHALKHAQMGKFRLWWGITILLGFIFLVYTGSEWHKLIYDDHLTISTNTFGTTYYALVGLHASHVIVGLCFLTLVLIVTMRGFPIATQIRRINFLSWYWHFVDVVWIVVLTVVYVIGR